MEVDSDVRVGTSRVVHAPMYATAQPVVRVPNESLGEGFGPVTAPGRFVACSFCSSYVAGSFLCVDWNAPRGIPAYNCKSRKSIHAFCILLQKTAFEPSKGDQERQEKQRSAARS